MCWCPSLQVNVVYICQLVQPLKQTTRGVIRQVHILTAYIEYTEWQANFFFYMNIYIIYNIMSLTLKSGWRVIEIYWKQKRLHAKQNLQTQRQYDNFNSNIHIFLLRFLWITCLNVPIDIWRRSIDGKQWLHHVYWISVCSNTIYTRQDKPIADVRKQLLNWTWLITAIL
jgi:hypothetical protein